MCLLESQPLAKKWRSPSSNIAIFFPLAPGLASLLSFLIYSHHLLFYVSLFHIGRNQNQKSGWSRKSSQVSNKQFVPPKNRALYRRLKFIQALISVQQILIKGLLHVLGTGTHRIHSQQEILAQIIKTQLLIWVGTLARTLHRPVAPVPLPQGNWAAKPLYRRRHAAVDPSKLWCS